MDKQKKKKIINRPITFEDKLIGFGIIGFWIILILFGLISLTEPDWLLKISDPGKSTEALDVKQMGDQFLRNKQYNQAIMAYKQALKILPDMNSAAGNLGIVYSKIGKHDEAIATFKYLLKQNPKQPHTAYHNIAEIYEKTKRPDLALKYYLLCAENAPFPVYALNKAGFIALNQNDLDKSIECFQQSLDIKQNFGHLYEGMLKRDLKNYSDETETQNIIQKKIESGITDNDLKYYDSSIFQIILKNDKELAKTHSNIANAMTKNGDYETAVKHYKKALEIWPSFSSAKKNLKILEATLKIDTN